MRQLITNVLASLSPPSSAERQAANAGPSTQQENDRWMSGWNCMNTLECCQPPKTSARPDDRIRVAAWNIERCKHVESSAALLANRGVDLVLATEMDWGCARSGQRHTTAELAGHLGLGHVFGVEFVELGLGDARETEEHAGKDNLHGLHGNAVLSRFPIGRTALIPLDDGGLWYVSDLKQGQRRIGGRNAIAVEVLAPAGTLWAVAVHLESESTPESRSAQIQRLLHGLEALTADAPVVIGGDFNVFELSRQGLDDMAMVATPDRVEACFGVLRDAGFVWSDANAPGPTTRPHPWQPSDKPRLKIDWLFTRNLQAKSPWILPAVAADGTVLSDHDPIGATIIAQHK